ncbi:unnamed protein product [Acanthosepion pharaonis]|uniref:Uncharacterized protein n=1 Tax=Acanthosepion pharaonis TaxID=158019 RepID=A0A812BYE6_ACAPH|nr:unnamed protein product [Sepia pharaonis]
MSSLISPNVVISLSLDGSYLSPPTSLFIYLDGSFLIHLSLVRSYRNSFIHLQRSVIFPYSLFISHFLIPCRSYRNSLIYLQCGHFLFICRSMVISFDISNVIIFLIRLSLDGHIETPDLFISSFILNGHINFFIISSIPYLSLDGHIETL